MNTARTTPTATVIADSAERERALDPRHSFIVQAPAGSGKTELLVRRFVRLLATVERPEEVLAITFTRKAAAEMKKRVLAALDPAEVANIAPRLRIMTIDALCAALTRQMPVLAKFGAQPAIAESDEAERLYLEAAARTLAHLEDGGAVVSKVSRQVAQLLLHLDNNVLEAERLLATMLARRDQWLRRAGNPPTRAELEAAFAHERERLLERAQALHPAASPEFALQLLTKEGAWRKRLKPPLAELAGNEPLRLALRPLLQLPPAAYSEDQWQTLEAILALLKLAAAELKLVFGEHGQADFTEYAQGAVTALGSSDDPSELLLRMDATLRHILVDEFQDTSLSQWQLLDHLTAGWEPQDGRTVFAVGDPMQSIYRFREAEVALFLRARHAGLTNVRLEPLTLKTNFRSQAGIVAWVNQTFSRVLPEEEDEASGAVPYAQAIAHPDNHLLDGAAATWHAFSDPDTAREDEALRVVELVRRATEEGGSCAILVRNRNALTEIVPALGRAGIAYRAVEIEKLGEKQVVQDLYALVRALAHPADRIAWLALLRARWCGLTLADLHALVSSEASDDVPALVWECMQDDACLARLSADGRARVARLCGLLAPALVQSLRASLRQRVEGLWLALGGPACVDERTDLEDAAIFFDRLDELDDAGDIEDLGVLAASLDDLYALPDMEAGDGDVQIMTMHKAKGLEFDTVILPGLDRTPRSGERPLMAWKAQTGDAHFDNRLLLAPINATGDAKEPMYRYVRDALRQAEDTESGRLLYVAATRARERLHLLGCLKLKDGSVRPPSRRSLLAQLWPVMEEQQLYQVDASSAVEVTSVSGRSVPTTGSAMRLPAHWQAPSLPAGLALPAAAQPSRTGEIIEFSWAGETARHTGSVVHRWLQRIAEDGLQTWGEARIAALQSGFRLELAALGVGEAELVGAATRVAAALRSALADERGRWLLGEQREARNEYRLSTVIGGLRRHFIIDRTFIDEQGRRWIVDYKTGGHEGADIEAFLDREQERYRAQLEGYAVAFQGRDAAAISFGLYFPLLGGWREWARRESR